MIKSKIEKLYGKFGRDNYILDSSLRNVDLLRFILIKSAEFVRGFFYRLIIKKSRGSLLVGKRTILRYCNNMYFGKNIVIGDCVQINALSKRGIILGNNVSILSGTTIECTGVLRDLGEGLLVGSNVGIGQNCFIQVRGMVEIEDNVIFGPNVSIFSENHNFLNIGVPIRVQGETRIGVKIESGVWLGSRAIIMDGVTIGRNSVVAAGSVVTKNVPPFTLVGGVPAKILKHIH